MPNVKAVHLRLDDETHKKLKVKAALHDETIQGYVEKLVQKDVKAFKLPEE